MASPELAAFHAALNRAWIAAGAPALRKVQQRIADAGGSISHTTIHGMLTETERLPRWETVAPVIRALDGDTDLLHELWLAASLTAIRLRREERIAKMLPGPDADLAGGRGREFRVTSGMSGPGKHEVSELTAESGLQVVLGGLLRWQALAIVSILHPPFEE